MSKYKYRIVKKHSVYYTIQFKLMGFWGLFDTWDTHSMEISLDGARRKCGDLIKLDAKPIEIIAEYVP